MSPEEEDQILVGSCLREAGLPDELNAVSEEEAAHAAPLLLRLAAQVSSNRYRYVLARTATKGSTEPTAIVEALRSAADRGETHRSYLWTLAEALRTSKKRASFDELAGLARDRRLGHARKMLLAGACSHKNRREDAIQLCVECLADEVVAPMAILNLLKLEAPNLRELIGPLAESKHALTAREAKKALRKLRPKSKTARFRRATEEALPGPAEWSSNFDESDLERVLVRTASLQGDPLEPRDLDVAMTAVESLSHDDTAAFVLESFSPVGVVFYVADEAALDVTFLGPPEVIEEIEMELGE